MLLKKVPKRSLSFQPREGAKANSPEKVQKPRTGAYASHSAPGAKAYNNNINCGLLWAIGFGTFCSCCNNNKKQKRTEGAIAHSSGLLKNQVGYKVQNTPTTLNFKKRPCQLFWALPRKAEKATIFT